LNFGLCTYAGRTNITTVGHVEKRIVLAADGDVSGNESVNWTTRCGIFVGRSCCL